jgi:YVTN family beta-propeller protein
MVTATRDGQTLFTSNIGSNNITVLERTGESWRTTQVPVGAGPEGLALSPDERELWTAHTRDGAVSVIDVASKKVVARVDARTRLPNRVKFTRDGGQAVISDLNGGELVVVDTRTRMVNRRVRLGSMPEGILIAPAGDRIYVAVTGENRVVALDAKTLNVVQSITTGRGPDGMAWVGR